MSDLVSGMIEAIEAAGQRKIVASSVLPQFNERGEHIARPAYAALGITFGPDVDDLFVAVTLPVGWEVVPRPDHSMWSELKDSFGRVRAHIFYKAAPYDRRAHIRLLSDEEVAESMTTRGKGE